MAWDRVSLYNVAAAALGETPLSAITDTREIRFKLDAIYTRGNGAISFAMEQGHWNFAMRAVKIDSDASVTPAFGFTYAFSKPSDVRKLNMMSADPTFSVPLSDFEDEAGYWWANVDPLYVRFVSDDAAYGADFSKWPESFAMWLGHWMALQIAPGMTGKVDVEALQKNTMRLLTEARSNDATGEPTRFPPTSSWASARRGGRYRRDRGNRASLIG